MICSQMYNFYLTFENKIACFFNMFLMKVLSYYIFFLFLIDKSFISVGGFGYSPFFINFVLLFIRSFANLELN